MGLDLSINSTGVCVRDGNGIFIYYNIVPHITRNQRRAEGDRLYMIKYNKEDGDDDHNIYEIKNTIRTIIDEYNITEVTMEAPALQAHGRASITMAGLNYAVRQMLMEKGIPFKLVQPTALKKWFTGNGMADKGLMVRCWKELDPLGKELKGMKTDDLADSYALCCWGCENKSHFS